MTTPEKKISAFAQLDTIAEDGVLVANQTATGPTGGLPIPALRTRLNTGDQSFTADVDVAGKVSANQLEGNGALISGVVAAGTGGTSSTGSLQLVANSDNSTPAAKVQISKYSTSLADLDETGLELKTGIPYSHQDDYAPFDKGIDLSNKRMIRNQTILDQTTEPFYWLDGVNDYLTAADNANLDFGTNDFSIIGRFKTSKDYSGAAGRILSKRTGSGSGYETLFNTSNKFAVVYDTASLSDSITSDAVLNDGKWHKYVALFDRDGNLSMYVDGKLQTDTLAINAEDISNAQPVYFGTFSASSLWFNGAIGEHILLNRLLTAAEAEAFSSNPQMALDYADEGGSNTELYTIANAIADIGGTEANATTGFNQSGLTGTGANVFQSQAVTVQSGSYAFETDANDTPTLGARIWADLEASCGFVHGKQYRVSFYWRHKGTGDSWSVGFGSGTGSSIGGQTATISSADTTFQKVTFEFTFNATTDIYRYIKFVTAGTSGGIYVDNLSVTQLGATAVYKGRDFTSELAKDSSGNDNHATVSGATLCNKSEQETEELGTWTPTVYGGTTAGSYTATTAGSWYLKKGRLMTLYCRLANITQSSGGTGDLTISNLPYDSLAGYPSFCAVSASELNFLADSHLTAQIGTSAIVIEESKTGTAKSNVSIGDIISGSTDIWFTMQYITAE